MYSKTIYTVDVHKKRPSCKVGLFFPIFIYIYIYIYISYAWAEGIPQSFGNEGHLYP